MDTGPARHAASTRRQPALNAEQAIGGEAGLTAGLAVGMRAADVDRPQGRHQVAFAVPPLEAEPAGACAAAARLAPFSSARPIRDWTALCRLERSSFRPRSRACCSHTDRTWPA